MSIYLMMIILVVVQFDHEVVGDATQTALQYFAFGDKGAFGSPINNIFILIKTYERVHI